MAVDSEDKRFSFVNIGLGWGRVFAKPDGTIADEDRVQALPLYSGIALTAVTIPAILGDLTTLIVARVAALRNAGSGTLGTTTLLSADYARISAAVNTAGNDLNTEAAIDLS
jgi:hypothetical protein